MNHRNTFVDFGTRMNFVVGKNGSKASTSYFGLQTNFRWKIGYLDSNCYSFGRQSCTDGKSERNEGINPQRRRVSFCNMARMQLTLQQSDHYPHSHQLRTCSFQTRDIQPGNCHREDIEFKRIVGIQVPRHSRRQDPRY